MQQMLATDADSQDTWPNNVVAIYNCDAGNFDTNDQADDWYCQMHYDDNYTTTTAAGRPISSIHLRITRSNNCHWRSATTHRRQQTGQSYGWQRRGYTCMPTMVCATLPTLARTRNRTTAQNSDKSAHLALWVQMGLLDKPQWITDCHTIFVCEVKQPVLSVTRLVEQGFQLTLDDNLRLQRIKGFNSTLENRSGLLILRAEITAPPKGTKLHTRSCRYRIRRRLLAVQHTRQTCQSTQTIQEDALHTNKNAVSSPRRTT